MSECEPAWKKSLRIEPPKDAQQRVSWFRKSFYRLSQEERRRDDGGDRPRRFVRKWPKVATATYLANQARLKARHKAGLSFDRLDRFYLSMNAFMRAALPTARLPLLQLNQPKPPSAASTSP